MKKLLLIIPLLFAASCTTTKYVPVDRVHRDSVYITKERTDTFIQRDSVLQFTKGDTVHEVRIKYVERYRNRIDTILKERTDTVTKVVEVERPLKLKDKALMNIGGIALFVLLILFAAYLLKWVKKL